MMGCFFMKPVSLLIFDLDGTLVDTLGDITASTNFVLGRFGRQPLEMQTVRRYVGDGISKLVERSFGGRAENLAEAVALYKEHHRQNFTTHSALYPSVRETLECFSQIPKAVITNKSMEFCKPLLEHLGIVQYFDMIIGADFGLPLKPAPDAIFRIMEQHAIAKERTAIIGDGTTDIQAGKAAGIITCAVTYGFRSEEELKKAGPDYTIHAMADLKNLFDPVSV